MTNRITTAEAADIYHIPARTLRRWANEGRLTTTRQGRTILLNPDELDQLSDLRADTRLPRSPRTTRTTS